jgi:peptide/nickel transport system permease protein
MMSDNRSLLQTAPWTIVSPGIAIFIAVMVFNLLGDTIRDFMDPQHRKTVPGGQGWLRKKKETPDGEV